MEEFVINWPGKNLLVVEKVQLLALRQDDLGVLFQKVTQRGGPGLLRAWHNEIESLHLATFECEHDFNRAFAADLCLRDKFFVTGESRSPSYELMLHELARTVLLIAEFTFVLIVLLILTLVTIPGRVRIRKR